ncbi:hypothetical protein [uncultured Polaribacter sp.]|uniref:hypothetical protein n=1 Tax=uncultured Polaribacter sp. TaxID=174711 RepID=UPI0026099626|nr:hypothetical protein [uncultured Polaribacter sp.]
MEKFEVSAWNSGNLNYRSKSFGIRLKLKDRNLCFNETPKNVLLSIEGNDFFTVNLTQGFWNKCPEFKHLEIGLCFFENGMISWEKENPPKFNLTKIDENKYLLKRFSI